MPIPSWNSINEDETKRQINRSEKDRLIEETIVYTRGVANLRSVEGQTWDRSKAPSRKRRRELWFWIGWLNRNATKSNRYRWEKERDVVSEWEKVRLWLFIIGFERRDYSVPWALLQRLAVTRAVNKFWGFFSFSGLFTRINFYEKNFINIVTKINKNKNWWH